VRASVVAGRVLRLITIPAAGSNEEGALGSVGGNGGGGDGGNGGAGGNGDGVVGGNDDSSLDGLTLMAPPVDLGWKSNSVISKPNNEPTPARPSDLLSAEGSRFHFAGSTVQPESQSSADVNFETTKDKFVSSSVLEVKLTDDYFSEFDDKKIM